MSNRLLALCQCPASGFKYVVSKEGHKHVWILSSSQEYVLIFRKDLASGPTKGWFFLTKMSIGLTDTFWDDPIISLFDEEADVELRALEEEEVVKLWKTHEAV